MGKAGFVTIIGRPNVGKSTLMNTLIGQKIAITSYKPQTTRNQVRTIYTDERGQIVFIDTPGLNEEMLHGDDAKKLVNNSDEEKERDYRKPDRLEDYMFESAATALEGIDCVLWLVEAKAAGRGHGQEETKYRIPQNDKDILQLLSAGSTPVIIVITKCDEIGKAEILPIISAYAADWEKTAGQPMKDIIPVSSRSGMGIDDLKKTIFDKLPEGEPFYDADMVTTQTEREIAGEMIREKALRYLQEEVPHGIAVKINKMHSRKGRNGQVCDIEADIICEREAHKGIIIGAKGSMLKKIGTAARVDIENLIGTKVNLQLYVKVRKDWKDDAKALAAYGYKASDLQD